MNNHGKNKEVSIEDLLIFFLTRWRSIILISLIGLVIGAGYVVVFNRGTDVNNPEGQITEDKLFAYDTAKTIYESSQSRVTSMEKYVSESAFMKINPYEAYEGTVSYVLECSQNQLIGVNASIYSYVCDGLLMQELASVGPYTVKELNTLINISQNMDEMLRVYNSSSCQSMLRISVIAKTEVEAEKLTNHIEVLLNEYIGKLQLQQDIMSYKLLGIDVKEIISSTIAEEQALFLTKYNTEKTNLNTYKSNFDKEDAAVKALSQSKEMSKVTIVKCGGVGFAGGLIVAVIGWMLLYCLGGKLYTISNKSERFGIKQLGIIRDLSEKKGIDKWIGKRFGGVYSNLPVSEQRDVVLTNIENELKKANNIKKIFVVSGSEKTQQEAVVLKTQLEESGYSVAYGKIIGSVEALQTISSCDTVILIEDNAKSDIALVESEIAIIKEYNDILGMIII